MSGLAEDKFVPVTREDVSDLNSLPRRFDSFAAEVRTNFSVLAEKLLPAIDRIHSALDDIAFRLTHLERAHAETEKRLAVLEAKRKKRK